MADNVIVTAGSGTTIAADELTDGTLGLVKVQYVKLMDGTLDSSTKAAVGANGLKVDGSGVTQPISGSLTTVSTVTSLTQMNGAAISMGTGVRGAGVQRVTISTDDVVPASQSGTWTIQPGNTANTTPWLSKLSDGTNAAAVKASSTAPTATDPALVVSISPNSVNANGQTSSAASAPVVLSNNQTFAGQNQATPTNQIAVGGQFNTTPTTITSGNVSPLQLDNAGNLLVNVKTGGAGGGAVYGNTANGSAAANPPVLMGGTANGTATGNVGNWKVDSSGLGYVTFTQPALVTGSAIIGRVTTDQSTPGTTDLVHAAQQGTWTVQPGNTANTTAWLAKIGDGTNSAAIKAASTAAVAADPAVVVAISPNNVIPVGGNTIVQAASSTITRPANTTAYASGQLVANSVTAGSVTNLQFSTLARISGGSGVIVGAQIQKSNNSVTNAAFRLHLFNTAPTYTSAGDGSALSTVVVASAKGYLGYVDITTMIGFSDVAWGSGAPDNSRGSIPYVATAQIIYGLLEARGAYTPVSGEVFTISLDALQD